MQSNGKRYLFLIDDGWRCEKLDLLRYLKGELAFDIATHDEATREELKDEFTVRKIPSFKTLRRFPYYLIKLFARELPTNNIRYKRNIRLHRAPLLLKLFYLLHHFAPRLSLRKYRYCNALDWHFRTSDFYGDVLRDYDVLIFSPVHMFDKRIIYEAKNRGLLVVCWVYSWDNPMKDNEFMENAGRYFVWNEQCAGALCKLHPVPRERVDIVGPVQFDYLLEKKLAEGASGSADDGGPEGDGRYVMYACATAMPAHIDQEVNIVLNIRRIMDEIDPTVRLFVRPYPYRNTDEVYKRLLDRKGIEIMKFGEVNEEMILMSKQDLLDRQSQIQRAVCLINHSSTIGLEASFTETPIVQLGFNVPHEHADCFDVDWILKNDHLQLVIDPNYPNAVHNDAELKRALSDILTGDPSPYREYSKQLQLFAHPLNVENYKQVFLEALQRV
jgi:hypothetical protein